MADLVRINTRISTIMNEWLDERSRITGLSKSTIVMLALEGYKKEQDAFDMMTNIQALEVVMQEVENIKKQLPSGK